MRFAIAFALFVCLVSLAAAAGTGITISRTAATEVLKGDVVAVEITVVNNEGAATNANIKELVSGLVIQEQALVQSEEYYDEYGQYGAGNDAELQSGGLVAQFLEWSVQLSAGETKELTYHIIADSFAPIILPPTRVTTLEGDYSGPSTTIYVRCTPNGACDLAGGENFMNCADCTTGLADGICDMAADGRNDPDCVYGADPDYNEVQDTDSDGIIDKLDQCALTPAGEKADYKGCSCGQKYCFDEDASTADSCDARSGECVHEKFSAGQFGVDIDKIPEEGVGERPSWIILIVVFAALTICGAGLWWMLKRK